MKEVWKYVTSGQGLTSTSENKGSDVLVDIPWLFLDSRHEIQASFSNVSLRKNWLSSLSGLSSDVGSIPDDSILEVPFQGNGRLPSFYQDGPCCCVVFSGSMLMVQHSNPGTFRITSYRRYCLCRMNDINGRIVPSWRHTCPRCVCFDAEFAQPKAMEKCIEKFPPKIPSFLKPLDFNSALKNVCAITPLSQYAILFIIEKHASSRPMRPVYAADSHLPFNSIISTPLYPSLD